MSRVLRIAQREFVATVLTKAFVIGLLFMPVIVIIIIFVGQLMADDDFRAAGRIAIVDPTGRVTVEARRILASRNGAERLAEEAARAGVDLAGSAELLESFNLAPDFTFSQLPDDADLEAEKRFLLMRESPESRFALVVVHRGAIERQAESEGELEPEPGTLGSYDVYVARGADDRQIAALRRVLEDAIVNLRIEAAGLDRDSVDRLMRVTRGDSITVTETEERETVGGINFILPIAFMSLLFIGIMGGGQGLMTSTIEEKASRVVEVLLSAVSPMQLMTGKLLGHMGISLVGMSIYLVVGLLALSSFSLFGLLDPALIVYLFIFFFIAFFVIGSLMLAVGAAVNELREAQQLMMPITILIMLPWLLWMPISRDPNSTLSVAASFIPPVNSFGMLLRLSSSQPPPAWQVWASIAIGIVSVFAALWCAARVFRIGLLLTGKPPNVRTLLRWVFAG